MAKVLHWEFEQKAPLGPGKSVWVQLGASDEYGAGALAITAIPYQGNGGEADVLKVENVNVTRTQKNQGDIPQIAFHAGCSVMNNGKTTVGKWSVVVGVISP